MKLYFCRVECESGCEKTVLAFCAGKEHLPVLVDAIVFPDDACRLVDAYEVEIPAAYILADQT